VALSALGAGMMVALCFWVAGYVIRAEVSQAIRRRTGASVRIGSVWPGAGAHRLSDVAVEAPRFGLKARLDRVEVRAPLFRLLTDGSSAVEALQVDGGDVRIDLTVAAPPAPADDAAGGTKPDSSTGSSSSTGASPRLAFTGIDVAVRDALGSLGRVRGVAARRQGREWHLSVRELAVGSTEGEQVRATGLNAVARVGPLQVLSGGVAQVDVAVLSELGDGSGDDPRPGSVRLASRLSRARDTVASWLPSDAAAQRAATPNAAADARPDDRSGESSAEQMTALIGFLPPGGAFHVARGGLDAVLPDGREPVMENFSGTVSRDDDGSLRTHGAGETENGGRVSWTLELGPDGRRPTGRVLLDEVPLALLVPVLPPEIPLFRPEQARVAAELRLTRLDPDKAIDVDGRLAIRDLALDSPSVASAPLEGVSFSVQGHGVWHPKERALDVDRGEIRLRDVSVDFTGRAALPDGSLALRFDAVLPSTSCGAAVNAIPRDALGELVGFSFDGRLSGNLHVVLDTRDPELTEFEANIVDGCRFETVPAIADVDRFKRPFVHRVREPDGHWFEMTTGPGTDNWVSIRRISPYFIHAVLAHEDGGFFGHDGFATWAIEGALERNLRAGRVVWGGSTITMQLAKNLFLARERTLVRKVQEVLLTWWLETSLDKLDILELYLNVIEYGPGVYGIRNAAWHYFRRRPAELSLAESAYLANILPAPKRYQTSYRRGELTPFMKTQLARRIEHMHDRERIDDRALTHGLDELERFAFADPASSEWAPPRVLPAGTAPLPRLGQARPEDWGWDVEASIGALDRGSPRNLDLNVDPEETPAP